MRRPRSLVDPRFQLKYTGLLVTVALVLLVGLGLVIWDTTQLAVVEARLAATQAENALKEAQTSARILRMNAAADAGGSLGDDLAEIDRQNAAELSKAKQRSADIERSQRRLLGVLVGAGLGIVAILGFTGVYITRKIVAPVFKLKRLLRKVGTGRLVVKEQLEAGDELRDLFHTFLQMTHSLRALQSDWLETLDGAIARLDKGGDSATVRELKELRDQLARGLRSSGDKDIQPVVSKTHPLIDTAVHALLTRFAAADYGVAPIIDLGTLIADADGNIDESEKNVLRYLFQTLLGTRMDPQMVQHLMDSSLKAAEASDKPARARMIAEILLDCDAVEPGLTVALTVAFASEGLSDDERGLIEIIAAQGGVGADRLEGLIAQVKSWDIGGIIAARPDA
jgi:tellurite resistance protein